MNSQPRSSQHLLAGTRPVFTATFTAWLSAVSLSEALNVTCINPSMWAHTAVSRISLRLTCAVSHGSREAHPTPRTRLRFDSLAMYPCLSLPSRDPGGNSSPHGTRPGRQPPLTLDPVPHTSTFRARARDSPSRRPCSSLRRNPSRRPMHACCNRTWGAQAVLQHLQTGKDFQLVRPVVHPVLPQWEHNRVAATWSRASRDVATPSMIASQFACRRGAKRTRYL